MKKVIRSFLLPWHTRFLPIPSNNSVFFGSFPKRWGGPDIKIRLLQKTFSNSWFNHRILYIVSGKPMPLRYVLMAKQRGCKVVLNQNGVYYPSWYKGDWKVENQRLADYHALSDHVLYQSQFCLSSSNKFISPAKKSHEILYNAVDTEAFSCPNRSIGKTIRLLSATNYGPIHEYALERLLESIAVLKKRNVTCSLTIAGPIMLGQNWLHDRIERYGISDLVQHHGTYTQNTLRNIFKSSDLFIHLKHNDACPNVVIEAMASGLPVVHSISGGTPELVADAGVGIAVHQSYEQPDVPSAEKVAEAVEKCRTNHSDYSQKAASRARKHFSLNQWYARHAEIFNSL